MKRLIPLVLAIVMAASSLLLRATTASAVDRIIVATFTDSNKALAAASAIRSLKDANGSGFEIKSGVILSKDQNGNLSVLEGRSRALFGTAAGTTIGALIGLIGGAPGMLIGVVLGATTGLAPTPSCACSTMTS